MVCLWIQWKSAALSQNPSRRKQLLPLSFTSCTASCLMQTLKNRSNLHQNLLRLGGLLVEGWKKNTLCPIFCFYFCVEHFKYQTWSVLVRGGIGSLERCLEFTGCGGHWWIPAPWKINADNISKATRTIFPFTSPEFCISNKAYK